MAQRRNPTPGSTSDRVHIQFTQHVLLLEVRETRLSFTSSLKACGVCTTFQLQKKISVKTGTGRLMRRGYRHQNVPYQLIGEWGLRGQDEISDGVVKAFAKRQFHFKQKTTVNIISELSEQDLKVLQGCCCLKLNFNTWLLLTTESLMVNSTMCTSTEARINLL